MQSSLTTDYCCHKFRQKTSPAQSSWQTPCQKEALREQLKTKNNASCKAVLSKPEVLTDQYCEAFLLMKQRCQTELKTSSFFKGDPVLARPYCPWLSYTNKMINLGGLLNSLAARICTCHTMGNSMRWLPHSLHFEAAHKRTDVHIHNIKNNNTLFKDGLTQLNEGEHCKVQYDQSRGEGESSTL